MRRSQLLVPPPSSCCLCASHGTSPTARALVCCLLSTCLFCALSVHATSRTTDSTTTAHDTHTGKAARPLCAFWRWTRANFGSGFGFFWFAGTFLFPRYFSAFPLLSALLPSPVQNLPVLSRYFRATIVLRRPLEVVFWGLVLGLLFVDFAQIAPCGTSTAKGRKPQESKCLR